MQREIAQFRDYVGHSWRTSSAAGTNIFALLGLMSTEVSRIVNAIALLLITALFSLVQVTARLVECLLDAWIDKCSAPGARMCIATYKTTHLAVIAAAVWWTYYTFAVRLFFDVPADLMGVQAVRDARAFGKISSGFYRCKSTITRLIVQMFPGHFVPLRDDHRVSAVFIRFEPVRFFLLMLSLKPSGINIVAESFRKL